ncbi:predicted protein [Botrytis cinerea T4]|uniref:Uncharacterized protein n=1 Tax=Botryotinia fuckeliana (strain T4) TaxID=999810 RepID=G2XR96_BOTF4|nr:predicted protein [Botrytis cinerea T4]
MPGSIYSECWSTIAVDGNVAEYILLLFLPSFQESNTFPFSCYTIHHLFTQKRN